MNAISSIARLTVVAGLAAACAGAAPSPTPSPASAPAPTATIAAKSDVCNGPDTAAEWSRMPDIVRRYGEAWMAPDEETRLTVLDEIWADDGEYHDSFGGIAVGRREFADVMAYGIGPGQYIEVSRWEESYQHNGRILIPWRDCCPTNVLLLTGTDVGEIDADGRLSRVTSFWDHYVEEAAAEACA